MRRFNTAYTLLIKKEPCDKTLTWRDGGSRVQTATFPASPYSLRLGDPRIFYTLFRATNNWRVAAEAKCRSFSQARDSSDRRRSRARNLVFYGALLRRRSANGDAAR